jgi:hypothetical protein
MGFDVNGRKCLVSTQNGGVRSRTKRLATALGHSLAGLSPTEARDYLRETMNDPSITTGDTHQPFAKLLSCKVARRTGTGVNSRYFLTPNGRAIFASIIGNMVNIGEPVEIDELLAA